MDTFWTQTPQNGYEITGDPHSIKTAVSASDFTAFLRAGIEADRGGRGAQNSTGRGPRQELAGQTTSTKPAGS